jgi:hypothetical protein
VKTRTYVALIALGVVATLIPAYFQSSPGYMDAEYYYSGGLRIANGYGFSEPFLWNYLDDAQGIPHPSHAYWMPLASILAAGGMQIFGKDGFAAARLAFVILGALIPPLTAKLTFTIKPDRTAAILAGVLGAISGFYLSYLSTTDTFGVYMILGALWLMLAGWILREGEPATESKRKLFGWFALGAVGGLMHLSRADGILWLFFSFIILGIYRYRIPRNGSRQSTSLAELAITGSSIMGGYLVIMGPWMLRNSQVFGALLSPGGSRALWLTDYDDLFIFPASELSFARWIGSGFASIVQGRWWALGQNLQTAVAVQGEVFLFPLILAGWWRFRKDTRIQMGVFAWLVTFMVMTFVFPYPGARGGFFHSGAALQPFMWAMAAFGLTAFVEWGGRWRGWNILQARRVFGVGLIGLAVLITTLTVESRVIGPNPTKPVWNSGAQRHLELAQFMSDLGAASGEVMMVNNPPGFYLASGMMAIPAPDGGVDMALEAARRYRARYLLLESNHPRGLDLLYQNPGDRQELKYMGVYGEVQIYEFQLDHR